MKKISTKIIFGAILAVLVVFPFLLGGYLLKALIITVLGFSSYEIASLRKQKSRWKQTCLLFVTLLMLSIPAQRYYFSFVSLYLVISLTFSLFCGKNEIENVAYEFLCVIILSLACRSIIHIYETSILGGYSMIYIGLACYLCDTGAYFFGVLFGKNKLIPYISPNKTWEGAIGGYFTGAIVSFFFGIMFTKLSLPIVLLSSLLLPLVAEIGDLSFSAIKRHFCVKDFGSLIPEHGGVLDRIDSLLFCLMMFQMIITIGGF